MDRNEILESITSIVRRELDDDLIELNDDTTSDEVVGWDSIAHIGIIVNIEEEHGIKFPPEDIISFQCVGDMVSTIQRLKQK